MPKNKKASTSSSSSSSDSDSGPEDRNPAPAAKKAKTVAPPDNKTKKPTNKNNDEPNNRWILEKLRFVTVNEFRGRKMVDIREHYEKNGEHLPTKKGISLSATQWKKLLEIAEEVNQALED